MADTFLFYDIETSGLNRAFDQILELAAIRTDLELKELERFSARIRLRPDVVPSPAAILVNRIRTEGFLSGRCEYEAIREIHAQLNRPGTTSIGYNSIGFDDEFLRFSFHRNLLPPYTHQYANRCRRMDLLPITIIYWLYRRDALDWPELNGKASLKLEDIGAANGLFTGQSHDAMSDVEAALRLARMQFRDQKMWQYLDGCFRRDVDAQRAEELLPAFQSSLGPHPLGLLVSSEFGTRQAFQAPVLYIGNSIPYPKQTLWLRLDLPHQRETRLESLADTTWVTRKRFGEPGILLPPHERYTELLGAERRRCMQENLDWLMSYPSCSNASFFITAITATRSSRTWTPMPAFIRTVFPATGRGPVSEIPRRHPIREDRYHRPLLQPRGPHPGRSGTVPELPDRNADRLRSESEAYLQRIGRGEQILDYSGHPRRTPQAALAEIRTLRQSAPREAEPMDLLADVERYITRQFSLLFDENPA